MTEVATANTGRRTIETARLEQAIAGALDSMRRAAAKAAAKGRDDFYDVWTAEVMDEQPAIFVAVALEGQTMAWLLDPSQNEGALEAFVWHHFDLPDANGQPRHDGPPNVAERKMWTRLYDELAEAVSWLVRERSGQHLREYRQWRPETD